MVSGRLVQRVYHFLTVQRRPALVFGVVGGLAALFAIVVFGWDFISGQGDYWHHPLYDAGTHVSGWLFYKDDSWRLPLFDTMRMGYPDGTSIILTDSIPLVALVAKLVGVGLLGNVQYFGLFVAVAVVLNALALAWTLWQFGIRSWLSAGVAVVFACFTTLYNIQFESFYAQFVVILSIGFYARLRRRMDARELALFGGMVTASLLIHPYIFVMSAALFGVTIVALVARRAMTLRAAALWLAGFVAVVAILAIVAGYAEHPATGYQERLYGTSSAFALDPTALFDRTYSVDEIGTYLGWGFWILIAGGAWVLLTQKKDLLKRYWPLVSLCVLFLAFALSNTLYIHGHSVSHIPLPSGVLGIAELFRASKRFIVPVYYVAMLGSVVLLVRHRSPVALWLVVVALLVQVLDTSYFVGNVYASARQGQPTVLNEAQWHATMQPARVVQVFPSYSCMFDYRSTPLSGQWAASQELYQIAAREGKISNSIRTSRRTKDCTLEAQTATHEPAPYELRIYLRDDNRELILRPPASCRARLQEFAYGAYCLN